LYDERQLVLSFAEAELPVVVQPAKVREFTKTEGILVKTNRVDAKLIARLAP